MLTSKPTTAMKKECITAAALGMLLSASAHATRAAGVDAADVLLANTALYGVPAGVSSDGEMPQSTGLTASPTTRVRVSLPVAAAQYRSLAGTPGSDPRLDESLSHFLARLPERRDLVVLLRNSDALVRATVRMNLGREWLGFVYADMGATDSAVRWQGLAGIHGGRGLDVLGGWRRVTYRFSPGAGLDSLDFDGPFLGATFAW
jgi:hypothetical protein